MGSNTSRKPPAVLTLDTSWVSRHGGITTFNRNLSIALAAAGAQVYCAVPEPTVREQDSAHAAGVTLVHWNEAQEQPPSLPDGVTPNLIIGHGRVTGDAARRLQRYHYRSAERIHVLHTDPDEIEWQKPDRAGDPGMRAEERMRREVELAASSNHVLAVGPRLRDLYAGELCAIPRAPVPVEINPGFDDPEWRPRTPPPGKPRRVLIIGRLEDASIKGVDIAARGLARALDRLDADENEAILVLRGVPAGQHKELYDQVGAWAGMRFRSVTRTFSVDPEDLRADLRRATLMLMPSRAEAFGLVAAEAIALGTPVLISDRSGLAQFLRGRLSAEGYRRLVVPVRDDEQANLEAWGEAINFALRDPAALFVNADRLRLALAGRQTWRMAAGVVLDLFAGATPPSGPSSAPAPLPSMMADPATAADPASLQGQRPTAVPPPTRPAWPLGRTARRFGLSASVLVLLLAFGVVKLWSPTTYTEIAGHRAGSPLFSDAGSTPVPDGRRIPYLTEVEVWCKVPDTTGMASVSHWYHIASSPYENLYSPSETFTNGDPPGGGTTSVDPAVPDCSPGGKA